MGSVSSIEPFPMVIPMRRTVIVPPANRANSESCRPQSAPAIPSPKNATTTATCPLPDHGVERGKSRLRQRAVMPQTWKSNTSTSKMSPLEEWCTESHTGSFLWYLRGTQNASDPTPTDAGLFRWLLNGSLKDSRST